MLASRIPQPKRRLNSARTGEPAKRPDRGPRRMVSLQLAKLILAKHPLELMQTFIEPHNDRVVLRPSCCAASRKEAAASATNARRLRHNANILPVAIQQLSSTHALTSPDDALRYRAELITAARRAFSSARRWYQPREVARWTVGIVRLSTAGRTLRALGQRLVCSCRGASHSMAMPNSPVLGGG